MAARWVGFALGLLIIFGTFASIMGALVVPRAVTPRLIRSVGTWWGRALRVLARLRKEYEWRDAVLGWQGPLSLILVLGVWMALLIVGFALVLWPSSSSFGSAIAIAGSSFFTLGTSVAAKGAPTLITFFAAASGLIVIALEIAYLPVLYGAFNRRESLVTLLDSSGLPSWGPEILARSELNDSRAELGVFFERWQVWAADVAESHSTYPVLLFLRSPRPLRSWVIGLLAVMDAAALHLSLSPLTAPSSCRPLLGMGQSALESVVPARALKFAGSLDCGIERSDFDAAIVTLQEAGWELETSADDAWQKFQIWRRRYASTAYALAELTYAPNAMWSGPRRRLKNYSPQVPPYRDPAVAEELRAITQARRERRHREQHEHLEHHEQVHSAIHSDEGHGS